MGRNREKKVINKNHFGEGPYPAPVEEMHHIMDIYESRGMCMISPKKAIDFLEKEQHAHTSYEFIIPHHTMHFAGVESSIHIFEKDKIFPINSEQFHGPKATMNNCYFDVISIEKDYLSNIAASILGNKNVVFTNKSTAIPQYLPVIYKEFINEYGYQQSGYQVILDCLAAQLAVILLRNLPSNIVLARKEKNMRHSYGIKRAVDFIRENYYADYSLEMLAKIADISPYHFIRLFKKHTGKTPYDYIIHMKIEKAKELLRRKDFTITQVCFQCGFNNHSHFTTLFKKRIGVTPSQYKALVIN